MTVDRRRSGTPGERPDPMRPEVLQYFQDLTFEREAVYSEDLAEKGSPETQFHP